MVLTNRMAESAAHLADEGRTAQETLWKRGHGGQRAAERGWGGDWSSGPPHTYQVGKMGESETGSEWKQRTDRPEEGPEAGGSALFLVTGDWGRSTSLESKV